MRAKVFQLYGRSPVGHKGCDLVEVPSESGARPGIRRVVRSVWSHAGRRGHGVFGSTLRRLFFWLVKRATSWHVVNRRAVGEGDLRRIAERHFEGQGRGRLI